MNGQANMKTSELIKKETPHTERGISHGSHFEVEFHDNSTRHESDTSWSDMSHEKDVSYMGGTKRVRISAHPIKKITITHNELSITIDVPKDCDVYQAIRSETIFLNGGERIDRVLGRVVGLVKEGEIIEERFLDSRTGEITGFRK